MSDTATKHTAKRDTIRRFPKAKGDGGLVQTLKEFVNTQSIDDPFAKFYNMDGVGGALDIVFPPYNPYTIARLPYENSALLQCIHAMVLNICGHGWMMEYIGPDGQQESPAAQAEKIKLENLFKFPNGDYSFQTLAERVGVDREATGNAYIETPRDRKGQISSLWHMPAQTVRRTVRDREPTEVEVDIPRDGADTSKVKKRFCRFVQEVNGKKVYFKEFGDPRPIDPQTGMVNPALPFEEQATEIIHWGIYYPNSPYGVPRWIAQLPSIMGSREAELTNLDFFKSNGIPAMAVLVAGGQLTQSTLDNIEDQLTAVKGREAVHRIVFFEARGDEDLASDTGQVAAPKLELKPLRGDQQDDAMFQEYEKDCTAKVRSAFRLPPLFIGLSEDMTYATAKTSYEVAESQVFGPERRSFNELMDMKILASYGAKFWAFRSQPARISDPDEIIKALSAFDTIGAMTPNTAIALANEFFDLEMDKIEDAWGNWPFEIVKMAAGSGTLIGMEEIAEKLETVIDPATGMPKEVPAGTKAGKAKPAGKAPAGDKPAAEKPKEKKPAPQVVKMAIAAALHDLHETLKQAEAA